MSEEFKIEAVKQVTEGDYAVADVAHRLGTKTHNLYNWRQKYGNGSQQTVQANKQQAEIHRLKGELKRVTEEREWEILMASRGPLAVYYCCQKL